MFRMLGVPGLFTTYGDRGVIPALRAGEPTLGVWHGGGPLGIVQAGFMVAKQAAGLPPCTINIAASAGALNKAASLSGESVLERIGEAYRYALEKQLLGVDWSIRRPFSVAVSFKRDALFEFIWCHLDEQRIRSHDSEFFIVAMHHKTGRRKLFNARNGLREQLEASVSIQGACEPVQIGTGQFSDGAPRMQVRSLLRRLINKSGIRHVLIVMTRPLQGSHDLWGSTLTSAMVNAFLANESPELRAAILTGESELTQDVRYALACEHIKTFVVAPRVLYEPLLYSLWGAANPVLLQVAWDAARLSAERIIQRALAA